MTFVKICGIKTYEDALHAINSGASALGFNFVRSSPRFITPADAAAITRRLPPSIWRVGVFADEEKSKVEQIARTAALNTLQFHGSEPLESLAGWNQWRVLRAIRIGAADIAEGEARIEDALTVADFVLLDALSDKQLGGTGVEIANSALALFGKQPWFHTRILLAGGLTPENVGEKIKAFRPFGVDVASGVESAPGVKDAAKMHQFVAATR